MTNHSDEIFKWNIFLEYFFVTSHFSNPSPLSHIVTNVYTLPLYEPDVIYGRVL